MELLTSPKAIDTTISSLLQKYKEFYWLSAWAGVSFPSYEYFIKYQHKCRKVIIGTHFYQTHPDFIVATMGNAGVKFVKRTDELFHPKAYLFYNSNDDWQLLIWSANFTHGAFTSNTEVMMHFDETSKNSSVTLNRFFNIVNLSWGKAEYFTEVELDRYRIAWKNSQRKRNSLAQNYGDKNSSYKEVLKARTFTKTWGQYMDELKDSSTDLKMRLELLALYKNVFSENNHFSDIPEETRKFIAGVANKFDSGIKGEKPWKAFGTMSGFGYFANRIIQNDPKISEALDYIPLTGQITEVDYNAFAKRYLDVFGGNPIGTATRLLAMKRPDLFYCLTSANQKKFCSDFGLVRSQVNLHTYWNMVVERIQDSDWWQNSHPRNHFEKSIKECRAAFLDSIYYQWE